MILRDGFYLPGMYYIHYHDRDWVVDRRLTFTENEHYYSSITANRVPNLFYIPGLYWNKVEDEFILCVSPDFDASLTYYKVFSLYVLNDTRNMLNKYSLFPFTAALIPNTVTLGTRESYYEM